MGFIEASAAMYVVLFEIRAIVQASRYMDKDFAPVHLSYIAPCVVQVDAFELLGTILLLFC